MHTLEAMPSLADTALLLKAAFVVPAVKVSLALAVLAIGLRSSEGDGLWLVRHPGLLARSILSINVIVPIVALAVAQAFDLNPAVKVALVAFSISPVPPVLPNQTGKAGGESAYAIGLLTFVSLVAIVLVPLSVTLLAALFGATVHLAGRPVAGLMVETVLAPLGVGLLIRRFFPSFAARAAKPVNVVGMVVLAVGFLLILFGAWPTIRSLIGNRTLLAIVIVTALGLFVGHELGGPIDANRPVLALASVLRHPAVAIAVANTAFPNSRLVAPAVLLQFIVAALAASPYIRRQKRLTAQPSRIALQERRGAPNDAMASASGRPPQPIRSGRSR
jgi:BASS family bile acid:Na+ symporter